MTLSRKLFLLVILLAIGSALTFVRAWKSYERYDYRYVDRLAWAIGLLVMAGMVTFLAFQAQAVELASYQDPQ